MKTSVFTMLLTFAGSLASADVSLTMEQYLSQVRSENGTYTGFVQAQQGAVGRAAEADLVTAFRLTGKFQYQRDQKVPDNPLISYSSLDIGTYSLGVSRTTSFGLEAKLSYDVSTTKYANSNIGQLGGSDSVNSSTPTLTLTQSLWQNAGGGLTKDTIESKAAQAESDRYSAESNLDSTIQSAISAYWTMVLQREVVAIRELAVKQSQSVYDYNTSRARMNLGEQADVFTAQATLESRKLDLQSAVDTEEIYRRTFNQYRNEAPMQDPGSLSPVDWAYLSNYKLPETFADRSDIKSAKFQAVATAANARILAQNDQPVLSVFGIYAMNGRSATFSDSFADSYSAGRPTATVGLNLSMPLDLDSLAKAKEGARALARSAETMFQQKLRDQGADWADIRAKVAATQRRVLLAGIIEEAQKKKLEFERKRLTQGRTSSYQVLLFEQDYTGARLTRIQTASELISLLSRARLYIASEAGAAK